ncbi:MAG: putative LPS assembly protein LptD, partial [Chitinivibrionales bacterium]|nr:putative LPS assembly protein LptD [Chitinivibrionales bacterium]
MPKFPSYRNSPAFLAVSAAVFGVLLLTVPGKAQPLQPGIPAPGSRPPLDTTHTADSLRAARDTTGAVKKHIKSNGITDVVTYEAATIDYDFSEKVLVLTGNASLSYQNMTLFADTIRYQTQTNMLSAVGRPQFIEEGDTTIGVSMVYNMKTRRGRVQYATTHTGGSAFNGNLVVKSEQSQFYVEQGDVTTCVHIEEPHYYFCGKILKIIPNDKIVARPLVFDIADVPVAILPYFVFPIERNRKSGFLTPVWGGHPGSGGFLDNVGYYFVPSDYVDFLGSARISEFQDFLFNASSRYNLRYRLSGSVAAQFAMTGGFLQQTQRWSLDYAHNQNLLPDGSFTLAGRGSLVSDKSYYTQFSEDTSQLINKSVTANLSLT